MLGGHPMVEYSVRALSAVDAIDHIVIALPAGVTAPAGTHPVQGGEHRSLSVKAALHHAGEHADVLVVHDAARPLVTPRIVQACLDVLEAEDCDAAIAASPLADTVKEAEPGEDGPVVARTLDRSLLWAVQTPQVFRRDALERALDQPMDVLAAATDDASLVEAVGGVVRLVEAPRENLKVTTPADLRLAELLLQTRARRG